MNKILTKKNTNNMKKSTAAFVAGALVGAVTLAASIVAAEEKKKSIKAAAAEPAPKAEAKKVPNIKVPHAAKVEVEKPTDTDILPVPEVFLNKARTPDAVIDLFDTKSMTKSELAEVELVDLEFTLQRRVKVIGKTCYTRNMAGLAGHELPEELDKKVQFEAAHLEELHRLNLTVWVAKIVLNEDGDVAYVRINA